MVAAMGIITGEENDELSKITRPKEDINQVFVI